MHTLNNFRARKLHRARSSSPLEEAQHRPLDCVVDRDPCGDRNDQGQNTIDRIIGLRAKTSKTAPAKFGCPEKKQVAQIDGVRSVSHRVEKRIGRTPRGLLKSKTAGNDERRRKPYKLSKPSNAAETPTSRTAKPTRTKHRPSKGFEGCLDP